MHHQEIFQGAVTLPKKVKINSVEINVLKDLSTIQLCLNIRVYTLFFSLLQSCINGGSNDHGLCDHLCRENCVYLLSFPLLRSKSIPKKIYQNIE